MNEWQTYASLMRQLAVEASAEGHRRAEREKGLESISDELAEFRATLTEHEEKLAELAAWLRVPPPELSGTPDQEIPDNATNRDYLQRGAKSLERSANQAQKAARRATRARLLPHLPDPARNFLCYIACAAAVIGVDLAVLSGKHITLADLAAGKKWELSTSITILGIVPALAFGAGFLLCGLAGAPRVKQHLVDRSVPMGLILALAAFPVVLIIAAIKHTS
ncbi:MAG TPA: hypothetical protein VHC49_16470 [Mycobacteriales bacterium]|nr:hypothetical protein [Mycobacteriales bacterium]